MSDRAKLIRLKQRWNKIFAAGSPPSLSELRAQGVCDQIGPGEASLRSLYWKLYLSHLPSLAPNTWPLLLARERATYADLRKRYLRAPDGSYPPELGLGPDGQTISASTSASSSISAGSGPTSGTFDDARAGLQTVKEADHIQNSAAQAPHMREESVVRDLTVNNPLSLDDSNPWRTHFTSMELRRTVQQDVERTFPDISLFRSLDVQRGLTNALFVWAQLNADVGYRQGMHELAAILWLAFSNDALKSEGAEGTEGARDEQIMRTVLSAEHIEHDTYALFEILMRNARSWYEWRETTPTPSASPGNAGLTPAPAPAPQPIVTKCEKIHALLRTIDPSLSSHLEELGIEPQIFGIRWVRLIFTREFPIDDALSIWDGLLAEDSTLRLVDYICVAMLLRIRNQLLAAGYSNALQLLLRYPSDLSLYGGSNHASLLVRQAIQLRDNLSPTAGIQVVMQNAEILGIEHASPAPASISDMPQAHYRARGGSRIVASGRIAGQRAPLPRSGSASGAAGTFSAFGVAPTAYLPEGISDLAKGIYERSDALGINRALVSTMANVQRTVGAYASGGYNAHAPQRGADGFPPLAGSVRGHHVASASTGRFDSGSNANTPEGHVANAAELRKELAALKASNKAMGAAVGACVEVFERMWAEGASRGALKKGNDAVKTKEGLSGSSVPDSRSSPSSSISTSPSASRRPSANFKGGIKGTATEQTEDDDLSHAEIEMLMSLTALKHIRDVLSGAASEFDPSILGSPSPASSPVAASKLPAAHATGPNASVAPQMEAGGSGTPARTQAQQHQQGVSGSPTMHKAPLPSVIQAQRRASASPSAPPPSAGSLAASSSPMHTSNSGGQAAGSAQSSETASVSRAHAPYGGDSRDQNFGSVPAFSRTRVQAPFTHPPSASASAPAPRAFPQSQAANTQRSAPPSDPLSFVSASTSSNASHIGTHACRPSRPATATAASTFGTSQPRQHQQQQQRASSTAYPPSSFSSSSTSAFAPASQPDMNNLPNLNARPDDKSQTSPLGPVVSGASPIQAIRPSPPPPRAHSPVVRRSVQISGADPLGAS